MSTHEDNEKKEPLEWGGSALFWGLLIFASMCIIPWIWSLI